MISLEIPVPKQQARAAFVALVLGNAILRLPENFEAGKAEKSALDRCVKWHGQICDEFETRKLSRHNGNAVAAKVGQFLKKLQGPDYNRVAAFWASVVLIWDLRMTCPLFRKHKAWRYLELAAEQLGRALLAAWPGADLEADKIYLELAW